MTAFCNSCLCIIMCRREGTWNRTLLSRVAPIEIIISHLMVYLVITVLQNAIALLTTIVVIDHENYGNLFIEFLLIFLVSIIGILSGLVTSCLCKNVITPIKIGFGFSFVFLFCSDLYW
jgi:ABC-type multidrug transport system permease subunit